MAKFKVGDKVKIAKGSLHIGEIGTIIAEKGSGYVVDIAGKWAMDANDNILVAANFRALNAKFKVGDRVNDSGTWGKIVAVLKKSASGETLYAFAPESGPAKGHAYEILEGKLSLNSSACNALKLEPFNPNSVRLGKSVWYKGHEMIYKGKSGGKVHLVDLGGNRIDVPVFDRNLKMLSDAYEYYHNDGVPMPNSRACNSTNPVVRKAMNAVAMNARTYFDKNGDDVRVGDKVTYMGRVHKVVAINDEGGGELYARLDGVARPVKHYDIVKFAS